MTIQLYRAVKLPLSHRGANLETFAAGILPVSFATSQSSLEASFVSEPEHFAPVHALAVFAMSEREQPQPQPEEPVTSIEDDGAVTDEQWQAMMELTMAIYDFREPE